MAVPDHQDASPRHARRLAISIGKWALFLAVLLFVGRELFLRFQDIDVQTLRISPVLLLAAFVAVLAATSLTFLPYWLLLGSFVRRPPWHVMAPAVWMGQLGKYVPGKVGGVAGIAVLLSPFDLPARLVVSTLVVVDGLSVVLGMATAIPVMLMAPLRSRAPMGWLWCAGGVVTALICLHPRVFGRVGGFILRKAGLQPFPCLPRFHHYAAPMAGLILSYTLLGLGCWLLANALTPVSAKALPWFFCAIVVAEVGGLISVFAPAGLGVQEGIMLLVLTPVLGPTAAVLAVLMRPLRIVAEVSMAAIGTLAMRTARRRHGIRPASDETSPEDRHTD